MRHPIRYLILALALLAAPLGAAHAQTPARAPDLERTPVERLRVLLLDALLLANEVDGPRTVTVTDTVEVLREVVRIDSVRVPVPVEIIRWDTVEVVRWDTAFVPLPGEPGSPPVIGVPVGEIPAPPPADTVRAPEPEPPAADVYTVPASIDATGETDVTKELLAFFESVPDGSTIQFPSGGRYRIDGPLELRWRNDLVIDGGDSLFFTDAATPSAYANAGDEYPWRNRYHWSIWGGNGITLRNMTIRGANAAGGQGGAAYVEALEAQHGVNIEGAHGVRVEDVDISHVYGDFVYIGKRNTSEGDFSAHDVTIRGGRWSHNGRQGLGIASAVDVLVENIHMTETRRASIDLEPNSARDSVVNVVIRDSYFGPGRLLWLAAEGKGGTMENITLQNNRLVGRTMQLQIDPPEGDAYRRKNIRFLGNTSDTALGSTRALMEIGGVDGLEIRGNRAPLKSDREMTAVELRDVTDWVVEGNEFPGADEIVEVIP